MYDLVLVSTFAILHNHHHCTSPEFFIIPNWNYPLNINALHSLPVFPVPVNHYYTYFLYEFAYSSHHIYVQLYHLGGGFLIISLSIFPRLVPCFNMHQNFVHFYGQIIFHCMLYTHILLIHSFVYGHLGFYILAIKYNNAISLIKFWFLHYLIKFLLSICFRP